MSKTRIPFAPFSPAGLFFGQNTPLFVTLRFLASFLLWPVGQTWIISEPDWGLLSATLVLLWISLGGYSQHLQSPGNLYHHIPNGVGN